MLVIPTRDRGSFIADALVKKAVEQGPPVWVYSTHRRSEVQHYRTRGIAGYVTTMAGYTLDGHIPGQLGHLGDRSGGAWSDDPRSVQRRLRTEMAG